MNEPKMNTQLIFSAVIAALGGFLFGYDTGVIGGTQLYFTEYFNLSPSEQGWAVSSALYGCLGGAIVAGYLSNKISRKYTLIISAFLFAISAYGSGIANSLTILAIYRIIGGIGVGIASMTAPMYIAEISPAKHRGTMVSIYQLAVVSGFFVVFLATYFIGGGSEVAASTIELEKVHTHNVEQGWRVMFWSELIPALSFFVLLFFVPHSPRWLMLTAKFEKAKTVLLKISPSSQVASYQFNEIKKSLDGKSNEAIKLTALKGFGLVLFIGIMLSVFQQVTGINAILYYGAEIFSNALGYGPEDALKQQLWLGGVNFIFTFVAIFTVDKWGRKPLLIVGTIGMFLGLSSLGATIYFQQMGVFSLVSILVFIGSFALSMGPVVWVLLSEIFPNKIRGLAMSIAVAMQWLFNAIVANTFPIMNGSSFNHESFNGALPYFVFAIMCVIALVFVWVFVPETKGKSLEELESVWKKN